MSDYESSKALLFSGMENVYTRCGQLADEKKALEALQREKVTLLQLLKTYRNGTPFTYRSLTVLPINSVPHTPSPSHFLVFTAGTLSKEDKNLLELAFQHILQKAMVLLDTQKLLCNAKYSFLILFGCIF